MKHKILSYIPSLVKAIALMGAIFSVSSPIHAASPVGDVVGKVTVGYQGWFAAAGDGSPYDSWEHQNLEMWPDVREYATTYAGSPFYQNAVQQPGFFGNLGNGQPAKMYSAYDQQISDTHCLWMQQNGIDCVALQRFGSAIVVGSVKKAFFDGIATRMRSAAETYGRKFYVMYDCNATDPTLTDWNNTIKGTLNLTASSSYAMQNGKPVVCFYGVGQTGRGATTDWINMINSFKAAGCYVIGSPQHNFTTDTTNQPAFNACNMILPWEVGAIHAGFSTSVYSDQLAYCNAHGLDYQGCAFAGYAYSNSDTSKPKNEIPRTHGDFMWSQFAGMRNTGVQSLYVAMFDEMNEGTSIFKCAEDASMIPAGNYFLTLDADGVHVSSDFYLRLTNDGGKMIKGLTPYQATEPTPFLAPVAAPTFNPAAGTYTSAQNVTITAATSGASIRYTTDGSTPSSTIGTIYSGPVNISTTKTLKAIAYKSGMTDSTVTSASYTIGGGGAVLLSQGHPVTASSFQAGNDPSLGNDGSLTTRWGASGPGYPQWWRVDLGASHNLSKVVIDWYDASARSYKYRIEVSSDDVNYTTVVNQTGRTATGDSTDNFTATDRYVRITVTGVAPTGGYASFYECQVYGN